MMEESVGPSWVKTAPWGDLGRACTLGIVSTFAKFVFNVMNDTKIVNHEAFLKAVTEREPGVGLLTVANHTR